MKLVSYMANGESLFGVVSGDGVVPVAPWREQLRLALAGLGFTGKEASDAIDVVAADAGENPEISALLRRCIQLLGRTR